MTRDEVLAHLLERVDALEQRVAQLESGDPWEEPFALPIPTLSDSPGGESQEDELADLSPDERAAVLGARQRLAADTGGTIAQPDQGRRAESDGTTVALPPVDDERAGERAKLAELLDLDGEFGLGFNEAYVQGGPLWLYYGNREYVLGLPENIQRAMVADVEVDSKPEAAEMAHDLLKVRGAQGPNLV